MSRESIIEQAMAHLRTGTPDDATVRWVLGCAIDSATSESRALLAERERERDEYRSGAEGWAQAHSDADKLREQAEREVAGLRGALDRAADVMAAGGTRLAAARNLVERCAEALTWAIDKIIGDALGARRVPEGLAKARGVLLDLRAFLGESPAREPYIHDGSSITEMDPRDARVAELTSLLREAQRFFGEPMVVAEGEWKGQPNFAERIRRALESPARETPRGSGPSTVGMERSGSALPPEGENPMTAPIPVAESERVRGLAGRVRDIADAIGGVTADAWTLKQAADALERLSQQSEAREDVIRAARQFEVQHRAGYSPCGCPVCVSVRRLDADPPR